MSDNQTLEEYTNANYDILRSEFVEFLISECGYSRYVAEESDDGFQEFVLESYKNR